MFGDDGRDGQGAGRLPGGKAPGPAVPREIAAEASVWIARLHGPDRSRHLERECLAWQAQSPAHRLAFERCTDLWMDVAGVDRAAVARAAASAPGGDPAKVGRAGRGGARWFGLRALASAVGAAVALVAVLVLQPWRNFDTYDTGIGEQRLVVLQDGTRMTLNTSTRVDVELSQTQRRVSVEGGEAFFEVAKDKSRPFVVQAAGTVVTATGTAFAVRLMPSGEGARDALDVTLVEGQVIVRGAAGEPAGSMAQPIVLAAGERVRVRGDPGRKGARETQASAAPERDRPRMDQVLAWKRGEAVFDNTALHDALAEMNRYSMTPIMADPSLAQLRISGQYKTGDNAGFARAVAGLHGLAVREYADRLELVPR